MEKTSYVKSSSSIKDYPEEVFMKKVILCPPPFRKKWPRWAERAVIKVLFYFHSLFFAFFDHIFADPSTQKEEGSRTSCVTSLDPFYLGKRHT